MATSFGGAQITRPGSYSVVDSSAMVVSEVGSFKSLAFIGVAPSLKAGTDTSQILYFNTESTKQASDILGEGDLLRHMQIAWKHGADLLAVSIITPIGAEPTDAEWQTAIDRLNKSFVDGVIPITTSGAIIAKVHTHCTTMSSVLNRRERRGFYGHAKSLGVSGIQTLVASANTGRALFASPAPYDFDSAGNKVLYDATLMAAAMAGLWAGKNAQDPITYDYVQFPGLEVEYEATDVSTLLDAGVAVVESTRKGFRIVQGKTASSSSDLTEQELSVNTLKDMMSQDMRDYLEEKHVGTAGVEGIELTIYNDAISRINYYKDEQKWISGYVQKSVKVVKDGTSFYVDWEGSPTLPINNFFITSHFTL